MKKLFPFLPLIALLTIGATVTGTFNLKIFHDYANRPKPNAADLFLLESGVSGQYFNIQYQQLSSSILSNALLTGNTYIENLILTNISFTNITVFGDLHVNSNAFFNDITVTNGITNLSLTANTVLKADSGKQIASIANGTGALLNDGAGNFSWGAVASSSPWTNNAGLIWPSGQADPDLTGVKPGPQYFFGNGLAAGTNATADINLAANFYFPLVVSLTDSNDPAVINFRWVSTDNETYNQYGLIYGSMSEISPDAQMTVESSTASGVTKSLFLSAGASPYAIRFTTNSQNIFNVDTDGLVTGSGYIDNSGTPGQIVAYGTGNRLFPTNMQNYATTNQLAAATNNIYQSLTNLASATITNLTVQTLNSATNFFGDVTITNGITFIIHTWAGPTNNVDINLARQQYVTTTDLAITNFINKPPLGQERATILTVSNSTASDHVLYLTATGVTSDEGLSSYTVTNGTVRVFSLRIADTGTNVVARSFPGGSGGGGTALPANAAGALTNNGSGTLGWYNNYASQTGNNAFTKSNFFSIAFAFSTNQNQIVPDFSLPEQLISTNAAFTFLAPVGIDANKVSAQWTLVMVTNTTAAAVLVTAPANCHMVGTPYVTNLTGFWFQSYAQKFTNCYAVPVF